jgi:hypothetical protein
MRHKATGIIVFIALFLGGCAKSGSSGATGQTATVTLKDGGSFSGSVAKSDTSAITLTAANGETRTYPMTQVDSVQYVASPAPTGLPLPGAPGGPPVSSNTPVAPNSPVAQNPPVEATRTLPAGATIVVRNSDTIRAGAAQAGQTYPGAIVRDVIGTDGRVAIPKGSNAMLAVRMSRGQGKVKGQSEIVIDLASVDVDGRHYDLETSDVARKGKQGLGKNRRSAKFIGGGAILGTVIGAVAGGGAGAAIGAASGGAAGAGLQAVTRGKAVSIPSETVLSFRLEQPVDILLGQ